MSDDKKLYTLEEAQVELVKRSLSRSQPLIPIPRQMSRRDHFIAAAVSGLAAARISSSLQQVSHNAVIAVQYADELMKLTEEA